MSYFIETVGMFFLVEKCWLSLVEAVTTVFVIVFGV